MPKNANAALTAKAKAWTFATKVIGPEAEALKLVLKAKAKAWP